LLVGAVSSADSALGGSLSSIGPVALVRPVASSRRLLTAWHRCSITVCTSPSVALRRHCGCCRCGGRGRCGTGVGGRICVRLLLIPHLHRRTGVPGSDRIRVVPASCYQSINQYIKQIDKPTNQQTTPTTPVSDQRGEWRSESLTLVVACLACSSLVTGSATVGGHVGALGTVPVARVASRSGSRGVAEAVVAHRCAHRWRSTVAVASRNGRHAVRRRASILTTAIRTRSAPSPAATAALISSVRTTPVDQDDEDDVCGEREREREREREIVHSLFDTRTQKNTDLPPFPPDWYPGAP
jgi:hypothetical protein